MDGRGVQEHYWTLSERGRAHEVVYAEGGGDGELWLQSALALCVLYLVGRLMFNGLVTTLLVGLTVALVVHLLDGAAAAVRPAGSKYYYSRPSYYSHF